MKEYAEGFYKSKQWQKCRDAYMVSVGGWCEICMRKGIYKEAEIVHHAIHIDTNNINNPNITLNWGNLIAVCRECHGNEHKTKEKRYLIDCNGKVISPLQKGK